jgi:hypothetical protein
VKILFPHSNTIAEVDALTFNQGKIVKHGDPVIVPEHPWEGVLAYLYGSVVKTTTYKMWYQAGGVYVGYARSHDGISWEKPPMQLFAEQPRIGPTVNSSDGEGELCAGAAGPLRAPSNVVLDLHMPSMIHDPGDRARPYKLFGYTDRGYCVAFSKDGIHFKAAESNPVIPLLKFPAKNSRKMWFSDVAPVFRDMRTGKFVSHVKTYDSDRAGRIRRCVGYSESDDFIHWSEPVTLWAPGDDLDRLAAEKQFCWADFYGLCAFNHGDGYLGLLWVFFIEYEIEQGTHEGKIEVFLAGSADGKNWQRLSDKPLIPTSPSGWDTGMITTANQPVFLKDRILLYYGGSNFTHGAGEKGKEYNEQSDRFAIGLATLRKDGFVYASSPRGRLTTAPLKSDRGIIKINADCTRGKVVIDVLQGSNNAKSYTMAGIDALDHTLRTSLKGALVIKVTIENAKLYSLEVL